MMGGLFDLLSRALTGESVLDKERLVQYEARIRYYYGAELDDLLVEFSSQLISTPDPEAALKAALSNATNLKIADLNLVARELTKLWYTGQFDTRFDGPDVPHEVDQFSNGLLWKVIGAHAPGFTNAGYGAWAKLPLLPATPPIPRSPVAPQLPPKPATVGDSYDIVIIGAGVGGAVMAWKLEAELKRLDKTKSILILDAGDNVLDEATRQHFVDTFALSGDTTALAPYRHLASNKSVPNPESGVDKKHFIQAGPDGYKSNYLRAVGGSTWMWRGNCPRWIPSDFKLKSSYGVGADWPITYDEIESYFCQAETELGVAGNHAEQVSLDQGARSKEYPMPEIAQAYGDLKLKELIAANDVVVDEKPIRIVSTPQARNSKTYQGRPPCQGNANCIPICPSGAKYDASVHLARLEKTVVQWHSVAKKVVIDAATGATSIQYANWRTGKDGSVKAGIVILAINAIETPRLWLMSGLDNSKDLVGRNLMDHLAWDVAGYMPSAVGQIFPLRGPQNTSSIFEFRDGDFRATSGAFNISVGNDGFGRNRHPVTVFNEALWDGAAGRIKMFGVALQKELFEGPKSVTRLIRLGYSTEQLPEPDNRVTLAAELDPLGLPRPKITYKLSDYSLKALVDGRRVVSEILTKAGVDVIPVTDPPNSYNGAGHPMGTMRMGTSADDSVVDSYGRSHAHKNIFLVGSSMFVTGSCVNPTLLLTALAIRSAEHIAATV